MASGAKETPPAAAGTVAGQVVFKGGGLPNVFVNAGDLGSVLTDAAGGFSFGALAASEPLLIRFSRTGFVFTPGVAAADPAGAWVNVQAQEDGIDRTGCVGRDVMVAKLEMDGAILALRAVGQQLLTAVATAGTNRADRRSTRSLARYTRVIGDTAAQLYRQNLALPETLYLCPSTNSCLEANLQPSMRQQTSNVRKLEAALTAVQKLLRSAAKGSGFRTLAQNQRRNLSILRTRLRTIPTTTFLCR